MVSFVVFGKASPAGSKRAFVRGGRAVVVDDAKGSRPWKQEVTGAALEAMTYRSEDLGGAGTSGYLPPLEGPLEVSFAFYVARPKGQHGAQGLRPSAPGYPITRPDLLKLARAVEDALSGVVYRDDAQIVRELLEKHYGSPARVEVTVRELAPLEDGPEALVVEEARAA